MKRDNYPLQNQLLQITTKRLDIRIVNNDSQLTVLCYLIIPDNYDKFDRIQITENCNLAACTFESPLFTFSLSKNSQPYPDLLDYYEECKQALLDTNAIKYLEYCLEKKTNIVFN